MELDLLITFVDNGYTIQKMSEEANVSKSTIRHWLGKHGLKTKRAAGSHIYAGRMLDRKDGACEYCSAATSRRNRFCNNTCFANHRAKEFGEKWEKEGGSALSKSSQVTGSIVGTARRFIFLKYDSKCASCGWTHDFGDGSLAPLECAHIDNNYKNNDVSNIRLLCPNCHAIATRLFPVPTGTGRWSNGGDARNQAGVV